MNPTETGKRSGRRWGGCLFKSGKSVIILAALIITCLLLSESILTAAGRALIYSDPPHKADAIAVLSGGGEPRLQEAARLYKDKFAPYIILTETGLVTEKFGSLSSIEKGQLVDMGVQPRDIFITQIEVDSTVDEAHAIRKFLNTSGYKSVIIVTDTFHSMRAHVIFEDSFTGNDLSLYIHPLHDDWFNAATWWTSFSGWQTTLLEYGKLASYLFTSKISH